MKRLTEQHFKKADGYYMKCSEYCEKEHSMCLECDRSDEIVDRLGAIEDILGNDYDLDRLLELVQADRERRCFIPPAIIGDKVYHITTCENFPKILDGTLYGDDGGHGTATGSYCPFELAETCPFPCDEDGWFDCFDHKNERAIFEDVVTEIVIGDTIDYVGFEYSGAAEFEEFGKTVFLTRKDAEAALKGE